MDKDEILDTLRDINVHISVNYIDKELQNKARLQAKKILNDLIEELNTTTKKLIISGLDFGDSKNSHTVTTIVYPINNSITLKDNEVYSEMTDSILRFSYYSIFKR